VNNYYPYFAEGTGSFPTSPPPYPPSLGQMPLIVITAGVLQDQWLRTVPELEARA
jgi:hypothetical protein